MVSLFFAPSLPEHVVVPVSLADQDLKQYSLFFTDQRIPVSSFSCKKKKKSLNYYFLDDIISFMYLLLPIWLVYTMLIYLFALLCRSGAGVIKMEALLSA